jgi:hypothetical protein
MYRYDVFNYSTKSRITFRIDNPFIGEYSDALENFLSHYSPDVIVLATTARFYLKKRQDRVCRFCLKKMPDVTFKKEAHVLPELMGNRNIIHDSECDVCNEKFSKYESDLASFLGMMRTADGIKGKNGIPNYHSRDGFTIRVNEQTSEKTLLTIHDNNPANKFEEGKTITLKNIKPPYIPFNVMKCFYKIGYSLLSDEELEDYTSLKRILMTDIGEDKLANIARVFECRIPSSLSKPFVVTHVKKQEWADKHIPTKVILIHFGKFVYQYFLPCDKDSHFLFKEGETVEWIATPPPYSDVNPTNIVAKMIDLDSNQVKTDDVDEMHFTFDKRDSTKQ